MSDELLEKLRKTVDQDSALPESTKAELLKHVEAIKNSDETSVASGGSASDSDGENHPIQSLIASIEGLETSHPEITALVNRIAIALGNMGI
jgi:hypothetical protein